jgi:hypothetical protein
MEWIQLITVVGANLAMFMWARTEARHDQSEMRMMMKAMQDEMKDFHARLVSIEERAKGIKK